MRPRLYHFTCDHGRSALGEAGILLPQVRNPFTGLSVIWLTTEAEPDREATGLGMTYTACDRMAHRYEVTDARRCRPWLGSPDRNGQSFRTLIHLEDYGDPEHWWITDGPTPVVLSRRPVVTA